MYGDYGPSKWVEEFRVNGFDYHMITYGDSVAIAEHVNIYGVSHYVREGKGDDLQWSLPDKDAPWDEWDTMIKEVELIEWGKEQIATR